MKYAEGVENGTGNTAQKQVLGFTAQRQMRMLTHATLSYLQVDIQIAIKSTSRSAWADLNAIRL